MDTAWAWVSRGLALGVPPSMAGYLTSESQSALAEPLKKPRFLVLLQEFGFRSSTTQGLTMQEPLGRIHPEASRQILVLLRVVRKTA